MRPLNHVVFILHQPRSLDNVGAVARVVKNFGVGRLVLVNPLSFSFERAQKLAVGAEDVLEHLFVEKDLAAALGPCVYSVGTSSRLLRRGPSLSPAEAADKLLATQAPVAVVFGDEKRGLSDTELSLCHDSCRIPSSPLQPSLNLAQATAVVGYALLDAAQRTPEGKQSEQEIPLATHAELGSLAARAEEALLRADFLNPQNPTAILRELFRPLERARLSRREAELWGNAFRKLGRR